MALPVWTKNSPDWMPVGEVEEAKEIQADKKRGYLGSLSVDLFWPSAFKRHGSPRTSSIVQDIVS